MPLFLRGIFILVYFKIKLNRSNTFFIHHFRLRKEVTSEALNFKETLSYFKKEYLIL